MKKINAECGLEGVGFFWAIMELICEHEDVDDRRGYIEVPTRLVLRELQLNAPRFIKLLVLIGRHAHWEMSLVLEDGSTASFEQSAQNTAKTLSKHLQNTGTLLKLFSPKWLKFQETRWQNARKAHVRSKKEEERRKKSSSEVVLTTIQNAVPVQSVSGFLPEVAPPRAPDGAPPQNDFDDLPDFDRVDDLAEGPEQPLFAEQAPTPRAAVPKNQKPGPRKETVRVAMEVNDLITLYEHLWRRKVGADEGPHITGRGRGVLNNLVKKYSANRVQELLTAFFRMKDKYFEDRGYTLEVFEANLTKIIAGAGKKKRVVDFG